jgi:transcriptional regulator with XRE-family HTH domain
VDTTRHYGLIIKHLREHSGLSVRKLADKIDRSIGWISEIENELGTSRLTDAEFQRIVNILDGGKYRDMFRTWVANHKNSERTDRTFDGAVLKFIRIKKLLKLKDAAGLTGLSSASISKIESGHFIVTTELRNKIMIAYGYSPSSFKNLSTDPVRSKVVPLIYKLEILLKRMSESEIEELYKFAREIKANNQSSLIISKE